MAMEQPQAKVRLEAQAGIEQIPADQARKDVPVLVKVVAPPKKERAPIDLVALLDVSGSMAWKAKDPRWTRLSLVSAAMQLAIRRLGAADRLAIAPFNHDVVRPTALMRMDSRGQAEATNKVILMRAGGDTKFLPALNYAKRVLDARPEEEKKTRPGFVFLLSDGEDGSGIVHRHVDIGYPVHTFGMCQRGSPQAMLHVARENKGTFHPIDDDVKNVALALGNFVGGVTSVVAVNTRVNFRVPDGSGVRITNIESGGYDHNWSQDTGGYIHVGVMSADESKKFIVHLSVPAMESSGSGKAATGTAATAVDQDLLTVSGAYNRPDNRKVEAMDERHVKVKRTSPATATPTPQPPHGGGGSPAPATVVYVQEVAVQIVHVQVVSMVQHVVNAHVTDGKPIDQKLMADELEKLWASFRETGAKEKNVGGHVDGGEKVVRELARLLREEEDNTGVLYAHAWLACHATQQVTTFAVSGKVESWFHRSYMALVAEDLVYNASSMITPPGGDHGGAGDSDDDPCKCVDFDRIDQRLELWSKVKREVPEFFQPSHDAESHHLTAVIREASLDAINKAMHQDMYLAVVHASNLRRCYCTGKQSHSQHQPHHDVAKPKDH